MTSSLTAARSPLHHLLARQGHRLTGPRRAILEAISGSDSPLTVEEIHARVVQQRVNRVTVYRTIHLLEAAGLLRAVDTAHSSLRYELGEQFTGHHAHLVCQRCGRVEELAGCPVPDDAVARLSRRVRQARQFRVVDHELRLLGLCRTCHA
ncbi:MAG: Fur family transcriptional regulator [Candidatus Methylomirabilales bacterium]